MNSQTLRIMVALMAVMVTSLVVRDVQAQCCPTPVVAAQPVVQQTFMPVVQQTYTPVVVRRPLLGGWYPGMLFDRIRARLWGVPTTYAVAQPTVVAQPTTFAASYAPTYTASYAPTYSASYAPTYTASYAPTYTASYAPTYTASYAPTYTASYSPTYTASYVTTASYAPTTTTYAAPATQAVIAAPAVSDPCAAAPPAAPAAAAPPVTYAEQPPVHDPNQRPAIAPDVAVPPREVERPPINNAERPIDPEPVPENNEENYEGAEPSAKSWDAPPLHFPGDRAVQRSTAPVRTAVLHRTATEPPSVAAPVSWQQAQQDATGWVSGSQ